MDFISWNICGLSEMSRKELTGYFRRFNPVVLGIIEPRVAFSRVRPSFWKSLNMVPIHQNDRNEVRSNIWIFAQHGLSVQVVLSSDQVVIVSFDYQGTSVTLAVVHGSSYHTRRHVLWSSLLAFCTGSTFLVLGDFNAVKGAHERRSLILPRAVACREFVQFIGEAEFIEPLLQVISLRGLAGGSTLTMWNLGSIGLFFLKLLLSCGCLSSWKLSLIFRRIIPPLW